MKVALKQIINYILCCIYKNWDVFNFPNCEFKTLDLIFINKVNPSQKKTIFWQLKKLVF